MSYLVNTHPVIEPSLLACDLGNLAGAIKYAENSGIRRFHLDIMDGHFVEEISFGHPVLRAIRQMTSSYLHAHLMVADPLSQISSLMMAGANALSFHYEAAPMAVSRGAHLIHQLGGHAGVAISPNTPVDVLFPYLASLDFVVVMSVTPGKCGQSFLPSSAEKVAALAEHRARTHGNFVIMVDGGINEVTRKMVPQADVLVMGSHFFKNFN